MQRIAAARPSLGVPPDAQGLPANTFIVYNPLANNRLSLVNVSFSRPDGVATSPAVLDSGGNPMLAQVHLSQHVCEQALCAGGIGALVVPSLRVFCVWERAACVCACIPVLWMWCLVAFLFASIVACRLSPDRRERRAARGHV